MTYFLSGAACVFFVFLCALITPVRARIDRSRIAGLYMGRLMLIGIALMVGSLMVKIVQVLP